MRVRKELEWLVLEVLTTKPQLQKQICRELKEKHDIDVSERAIRDAFKGINQRFINGEIDFMIVSNQSGSYISRSEAEIARFNENRKKQALSLLYGVYKSQKQIGLNKNYSFAEFAEEGITKWQTNDITG